MDELSAQERAADEAKRAASAGVCKLALSLRQPWAYFMLNIPAPYRKCVENRTWNTKHRGPCWVHASAGMTRAEFDDACSFARRAGVPAELMPGFDQIERGGIVGRWKITSVYQPGVQRDRWHMQEQFGYVVEDAERVPFLPCNGALGFWTVPADLLSKLSAERIPT